MQAELDSPPARGYGDPPPGTVIVVGMTREFADRTFDSCRLAARLSNPHGIENDAIKGYEDVFLCRGLREPWPEFWMHFQYFG